MRTLAVVVVGVALLVSAEAWAQPCGDADRNGTITVTDGVRALRRAAALPPGCDPRRCDIDGNEAVTLTDGVSILRLAAGLSVSALACPTPDVGEFADQVENADGSDADLDVGVAPLPGQGAPSTVQGVEGSNNATPGGESTFAVSYDAGATGGAAIAAGEPELLIAVRKPNRQFARGFFRLPLPTGAGEVGVTIRFPNQLPDETFFLAFATRQNGELGQYQFFAIRPGGTDPTPTPTATPVGPVCGNSKVEAGETCDPPGGSIPGNANAVCRQNCTYCGDLVRNGPEECDGLDDPICEIGCQLDCECFPVPR